MQDSLNVLFLCTGNSARSILSEALLNDLGEGRFAAFSAGSKPSGQPVPEGLLVLQGNGHDTARYRSKSWDEFAAPQAPIMDIIVTVCGNAAGEVCPVWPKRKGHTPITVHWGAPDPAHIEPRNARITAFEEVYALCRARVEALIALPQAALSDRAALQAIGEISA